MAAPKTGQWYEIYDDPRQAPSTFEGRAIVVEVISSQKITFEGYCGEAKQYLVGRLHKCRVYFGNEPTPYIRNVFRPE